MVTGSLPALARSELLRVWLLYVTSPRDAMKGHNAGCKPLLSALDHSEAASVSGFWKEQVRSPETQTQGLQRAADYLHYHGEEAEAGPQEGQQVGKEGRTDTCCLTEHLKNKGAP